MTVGKYWVYIMGGAGTTTYVGFTNDVLRRVWEHRNKIDKKGFTARYNLDQLLFCTEFGEAIEGIAFEKRLKGWCNAKKEALIAQMNPERVDLADDWYGRS